MSDLYKDGQQSDGPTEPPDSTPATSDLAATELAPAEPAIIRSPAWVQRVISVVVVVALIYAAFTIGRANGKSTSESDAAADVDAHAGHDHEEGEGEATVEEQIEYVCPMHPQIRQDEPGICPICFMELVPVSSGPSGGPDGVTMTMSDWSRELAHVRTQPVERVALDRELHAFGRVTADETRMGRITAWTGGRIDRMYVDTVGEVVSRGQRLARIYAPELVIAQETLLHAHHSLVRAQGDGSEPRIRAAEATIEAARSELRLLGMDQGDIEDIIEDGEADEYVTLRAPASGTVTAVNTRRGDYVSTGAVMLELSDLDEVWAQIEIYERDLHAVAIGDAVELRLAGSVAPFASTITFIDPVIDAERRIARARVTLPNDTGDIRPGTFLNATIRSSVVDNRGRPPVAVPESAVLWTGRRSIVYVYDAMENPPVYMPIEVTLGEHVDGHYVIEDGVWPGEVIVTNGAFRIDASLQIRGGQSMMNPRVEDPPSGTSEPGPTTQPTTLGTPEPARGLPTTLGTPEPTSQPGGHDEH